MIAIIPAVLVILIYGDNELDALLILSQVILSLQLGFAIIPLLHFVSDKSTMGKYAIKWPTKVAGWLIAIILVTLNVRLVVDEFMKLFETDGQIVLKTAMVVSAVILTWLFITMTIWPFIQTKKK
jgi:manganese transport protein